MPSVDDIEKRIRHLEDKFKYNFFEIEKRFAEIHPKETTAEPSNLADRVQYIEDLLLMVQVENEKLREMILSSPKNYTDEIHGVENPETRQKREDNPEENEELHYVERISIEKRFDNLEKFLTKEIAHLDERLRNIEDKVFNKTSPPEKNVLEELHHILKG